MSNQDSQPIHITVTIQATLATTWHAFTDPKWVKQWHQASDDWHVPNASIEFVVGGVFCITMAAKDGSMAFDFCGHYQDIIEQQRIHAVLDDGRAIHTHFTQLEGHTQIQQWFDAESSFSREQQQQGWLAMLDNLKSLLEQQPENETL